MNRDQIERALRDPGPREAGYVEQPLRLGSPPERGSLLQTTFRIASFGAVAVAGAAVALLLTRGSLFAPTAPGAGTTTPTATPASANRACSNTDLAWTADPWGGAAGSRGTTVTIRGVSSLIGCRIVGSAGLVLRDANGAVLVQGMSAASAVDVKAGSLFRMGIMWSNWCGSAPASPLTLSLTLPGGEAAAPLPVPGTIDGEFCNGPGQASSLTGTDFQPAAGPAPEG